MKFKIIGIFCLAVISIFSLKAQNTDSTEGTGLDGDHFSLEGALEMFEEAKSLEEYEKLLNQEDKNVNNLDLNEDGNVDYVRVVAQKEGNNHAIVLQVSLSETESQDIAVIGIEKQGAESALLQIIGDPDLYGSETIVEPFAEETKQSGKGGPLGQEVSVDLIIVNVWLWPSVRFLYHPSYVVYVSPWRFGRYPSYWRVWHPHSFHVHHSRRAMYNRRFRVCTTNRIGKVHRAYNPHRRHSTTVRKRTTARVKYNNQVRTNNSRNANVKKKNHKNNQYKKTTKPNRNNTTKNKKGKVNKSNKPKNKNSKNRSGGNKRKRN